MKKTLLVFGSAVSGAASAPAGLLALLGKRGYAVSQAPSLPFGSPLRVSVRLAWLLKKEKPSLIHWATAENLPAALRAARWAKASRLLVSLPAVGDRIAAGERGLLKAVRAAVGVPGVFFLCENPDDLAALESAAPGAKAVCAVVRSPSVSLARFYPPKEVRVQVEDQPVRILFAQRLSAEAGLEDLRKATAILRARRCDAEIVVAGVPRGFSPELLQTWRNEKWVKLLGHVEAVDGLLRGSDIVVATSTAPGAARFLLEAAATGRAIACADTPSARRLLTHEKNALFYKPGDASALARAIERLIKDPELRERLGEHAKGVASRYGDRAEFEALAVVYDSLLG
jgi:glycosyltransferase involved in cell wall biosynthesis